MVQIVGEDKSVLIRKTCHGCASIVEFSRSEAKPIDYAYDYTGDHETANGVKCPKCGSNIFIK